MLMTGTALAQLIPLLMSPYLSRVYSPSAFGMFGLYFNAVSMLGVIMSLRYELCIVLPEKDEDSMQLVYLCTGIAFANSLIILIISYVSSFWLSNISDYHLFKKYIWTIPVSALFVGIYQAFNYYLTKGKAFRASAINRVVQKSAEGVCNIGFGQLQGSGGLIWSDMVGRFLVLITAVFQSFRMKGRFFLPDFRKMKELSYRYRSFALNGTIPAFFNAVSLALPVYYISWFFDTEVAGQFNLSRMVLAAPISIITVNIGQVLMQRMSEIKNDEKAFRSLFMNVFRVLAVLGGILLLILVFFSVPIFGFVFGNVWKYAGKMTIILSISYVLRFIIGPFGVVFTVKEEVKTLAIWQIAYGTCIGLLYVFRDMELTSFLWIFTGVEVVFLLVFFLLVLRTVFRKVNTVEN